MAGGRPQNAGMEHHPKAVAFRDATTFCPQRSFRLSLISPLIARQKKPEAGLEGGPELHNAEVPPQLLIGGRRQQGLLNTGHPPWTPSSEGPPGAFLFNPTLSRGNAGGGGKMGILETRRCPSMGLCSMPVLPQSLSSSPPPQALPAQGSHRGPPAPLCPRCHQ